MSDAPARPPAGATADSFSLFRQAGARDARLLASLDEGVWERDLVTGDAWYSPRSLELLGYPPDADPATPRDALHPDDRAAVERLHEHARRTFEPGGTVARLRCRDGTLRWFRCRFRVWPDADGTPRLLVGSMQDVHDDVALQSDLRAQQAELEARVRERTTGLQAALELAQTRQQEAERANGARASFLTHMSHELRTPLNGVLGMTQLALGLAQGGAQRRYLELARQAGQTLLGFLDDVLDFARDEAVPPQLRPEPMDLCMICAETLRSFIPSATRKGLRVGFDFVGDLTHVIGDAGRLRQMLGHLIGNAIKFTTSGWVVLVVATKLDANGDCRIRIRVRDTGVGMDAATLARVFEPFEQGDNGADRRHGGIGIGLAVVRMLVQRMGGRVSARSAPGRGATFRIDLRWPLTDHQPLQDLAEEAPRRALVWIVGDDPVRRDGLRRRIARLGWTARTWPDLDAAVGALGDGSVTRAERPDGVVVGADALRDPARLAELRERLPRRAQLTLLAPPGAELDRIAALVERSDAHVVIAPATVADLYGLVDPRAASPSTAMPLPALDPPADKPHVLVVEDNLLNQLIVREMVAALGAQPSVVGSGEEAVLSCQRTPPALVLMDVQMPGMDGLETTRRLRALQAAGELRPFPIVALTAHAMADDRRASIEAGMDEHLTKPIQMEQLRSVLLQWLATD